MPTNLLELLRNERVTLRKRLWAVETALNALNGDGTSGRGGRRRRMSAEARAKISAAAKKRWAKRKAMKK
jgi:hypothetical protein